MNAAPPCNAPVPSGARGLLYRLRTRYLFATDRREAPSSHIQEWKSMKKSLKAVERQVSVQLVVSRAYSLPLCIRLRYEPTDPYVVRTVFFVDCDEPVEWVLGRDLLTDGLKGCAGCADVRIWSAVGRGDQWMYIALGSSAGTALLEVPVRDITSFLQDTEALVPRGTESAHIDWDAELAHLLPHG
ncbi:SsgA family sporulation/cell division regulator [Streptomyces sp. NPDC054794]